MHAAHDNVRFLWLVARSLLVRSPLHSGEPPHLRILLTNDDGTRRGVARSSAGRGLGGSAMCRGSDREAAPPAIRSRSNTTACHPAGRTPLVGVRNAHRCGAAALETLLPQRPDGSFRDQPRSEHGEDVNYSGDSSRQPWRFILGVPAIAVSLAAKGEMLFDAVGPALRSVLEKLVQFQLAKSTLLNVNLPNIPSAEVRGVRITRLGSRQYRDSVVPRKDPRGRDYYWIGGTGPDWTPDERSDAQAVAEAGSP